jgi:hypothetical protein
MLKTLITEMRAIQHELGKAAIAARHDPLARSAVIELRRRSAEAAVKVCTAVEIEPAFQSSPQLAEEFRARFQAIRNKIAIFQAKWPAVLLSDNDPHFVQSAQDMRAANREFDDWVARFFPS